MRDQKCLSNEFNSLMAFKFKALYIHGNALMDRLTVNL